MSMTKIKLFNLIISLPRVFLIRILAFVISLSSVTAVAIAAGNSYNIIEAARANIEIESCSYLGKVWGTSDWGKSSKNARKHKAEDKVLKMAAELNATHLVWREHSAGSDSYPQASGDAYRCVNERKPDIAKK
ncbi:hypothetical protein [Nitrosomonas sp. Nm132]|jgi:hypothetical protein|uniref:hypothetical protein n=1 Tax=Nitrosomonas sp. Nm132 TaxID=1881053 RepID=UPI00088F4349|nr:hypothetical protein [Nitrosomonas sp. Nm132]SDH88596.1 hypothetical protein SAMN05428952_104017 [Nitrosomonas sp. Nm132]